jgi:hypothetical protein
MSRRVRKPEAVRLEITRGDWLLVKKHLTAGEYRLMMARTMRQGSIIEQVDSSRFGLSKCAAYLLDWSVEDADGKPLVVQDKTPEEIEAALDAVDVDSFREVRAAIERHEDAMEFEIKNELDGVTTLPATSPSPDSLA